MKNLSSLEIRAVVDELQKLVDGKVDQIYQPDNTEVIVSIHKTGLGRNNIRIISGIAVYISSKRRKSPQQQINFCRFLRKRLKNSRLRKIEQKDFERIIELHFEAKEQNFIMVCEFFSKGNVILCDEKYTIISALQVQLWKDRKIKAKVPYQYPPRKKILFDDYQDFAFYIEQQEKESIVKKLATMNLGGLYAEEICSRAGVDKDLEKPTHVQMKRLFSKYNELFDLFYEPNIVKGNPVPFSMESLGEGESTTSYNEALDIYYKQFITDEEIEEEEKQVSKKTKYENILKEQESQLKKTEDAIAQNREKGDWVYTNYIELKEYIDLYKQNKAEILKKKGVEVEGTNLLITI
jgi:predicted ribosome quality control (RQC) complex YloA/Tae2 family protein